MEELLADEEVKEFFHDLAMARMAGKKAAIKEEGTLTIGVNSKNGKDKKVDVDEAWKEFAHQHHVFGNSRQPRTSRNRMKMAASVIGIVFLSGVAFAAAIHGGWFKETSSSVDENANKLASQVSASQVFDKQSTSRLHAEDTKVAAFAGCDFSIAKFSASLGMRFETFAMLYRDAMTQDKLVDKTATSFLSIFLFINLHHHWMPYLLLSYNSDGNMREYRVRQALWCSLGVTKHFSDNAWMLRLSLNNILGTKEHEIRSVKRRQINDSMNG